MGSGVGTVGSAMQPTGGQTSQPMGSGVNQFGGQNPYANQSSLMSNQMGSGMTGQATYLTNPGFGGQNQYAMTRRPDFQAMQQPMYSPFSNFFPQQQFGFQNPYAARAQQMNMGIAGLPIRGRYGQYGGQFSGPMGYQRQFNQAQRPSYQQPQGQVGYPQPMEYPQPMQSPQQEFDAGMGQVSINPIYPYGKDTW